MIPFGEQTITVFNEYHTIDEYGKTQTRWTSYVFENALFRKVQQTKISEMVSIEGDYYVAQASFNENYLPFSDWIKQDGNMEHYFTVQNGDIIVEGDFAMEIPFNSSPLTELKKLYPKIADHSFVAKTAQVNTSSQFKNTKHYFWGG